MAGYSSQRILEIFLNSDIDYRNLYIDPHNFSRDETPDQLNQRYLRGAMETGCRAVHQCLESAGLAPRDIDLFLVCTGYLCPDLASRLIEHMHFRSDVQRAPCPLSSEPGITHGRIPVATAWLAETFASGWLTPAAAK
jgi:predicted naringenin-chalcone synthase